MATDKKRGLNVPNTLSLLRVLMVPLFIAALLFMRTETVWDRIVPALIFALTALTDMLDGKIARKYNLVTDFGKFIDPLADKFMVFGSLCAMLVKLDYISGIFVWVAAIIMLRELAVTSLRLVAASGTKEGGGVVIAASMLGKIKTTTQMIAIIAILLEPLLIPGLFDRGIYAISYVGMALMLITTVVSGIDYLRAYWPLIDTNR